MSHAPDYRDYEVLLSVCRDKPALEWQMMNACALDFPDASFDAAVDKGTLDSVLCGEGSTANVAKMCMEISRVLKPNGVFFICSYGVPDNRVQVSDERLSFRLKAQCEQCLGANSAILGPFLQLLFGH